MVAAITLELSRGGSFRDVNIATTGHFFDFDFVTPPALTFVDSVVFVPDFPSGPAVEVSSVFEVV